MSPSINIPQPAMPKAPGGPPMFGSNTAAGMKQKKQAAADQNAFGSFLGTQAQAPASTGSKTLLGQ